MSSIVQIKDSAYDGLQSLRVYGNTKQNLWVNPSGTQNGVTVTANDDGSITISGSLEVTTNGSYNSTVQYILRPGSTYTLSVDRGIGGVGTYLYISFEDAEGALVPFEAQLGFSSAQSRVTFTVPTGATSARMGIAVKPNTTPQTGTYRVMLNEGSTAEPWCPPGLNSVGDGGSVKVVTAGKNFWDNPTGTNNGLTFSEDENGVMTIFGTVPEGKAAAVGHSFNHAEVFRGKTMTVSCNKSLDIGVVLFLGYRGTPDAIGGQVFSKRIGGKGYPTSQTVVINDDIGYFWLAFSEFGAGSHNITDFKVQLELGSTATTYEPPNITTTPIDLQGHTLNALPDGTRDELHIDGGGNVVLEKRVGVATAPTAAGSWQYAADVVRASFALPSAGPTSRPNETSFLLCDKLPVRKIFDDTSYALVSNWLAYAKNPAITSAATAATVAGGATYIYQLAEPQTIDLGTIDFPKLRKKPLVNTIWANGTSEGTGFSLAPEIDCEYNRWSTYCDGFKTHGKHSYFDMGCCVAARDTGTPEKKSVTATVPYMSGYYDFSKLYGAIAFEARQLTYRFEFVEDSREELQQKKSQFLEWLSQVHDEEIADDDIPGRHFIGSLSEWEFEEGEEGQSGSLEVTFNCQPFLEADEDTTKTCNAGSNTVTVEGQAVNAYAKTSSGTATIQIGGVTQSVGTTEIRLSVQLQPGDNAVTVTGSPVVLRWKELTA